VSTFKSLKVRENSPRIAIFLVSLSYPELPLLPEVLLKLKLPLTSMPMVFSTSQLKIKLLERPRKSPLQMTRVDSPKRTLREWSPMLRSSRLRTMPLRLRSKLRTDLSPIAIRLKTH